VKITDIQIVPFRWKVDRYRHGKALPKTEVTQTILKILTDEGAEGYYFGGGAHGDEEGVQDRALAGLDAIEMPLDEDPPD